MTNIFNTSDYDFLKSFFVNFAVPTLRINLRVKAEQLEVFPTAVIQRYLSNFVKGVSFVADDWLKFHYFVHHILSPDKVFRVHSAQLVTRLNDDRSILVMSTESELSNIFDFNPIGLFDAMFILEDNSVVDETMSPNSSILSSATSASQLSGSLLELDATISAPTVRVRAKDSNMQLMQQMGNPSSSCVHDTFQLYEATTGSKMSLLSEPLRSRRTSQMILILNGDKRIESMVFGNGQLPPEIVRFLENEALRSPH